MLTKETMLQLLRQNVVPALGCTEPVCVALAAADAAKSLCGEISKVKLVVSGNILKNGMSVGIPGFPLVGLNYAAALGALLKNPEKKLELLEDITDTVIAGAMTLVSDGKIEVTIDEEMRGVYVWCQVITSSEEALTVIQGGHANVVLKQVNGEEVLRREVTAKAGGSLAEELRDMTIAQMRELVDSATEDELAFLLDGVEMNRNVAAYSLSNEVGVGVGATLLKSRNQWIGDGLLGRMLTKVAAATEGRLDGCPYAVMSSAGSGSKGIAVILPVAEMAEELGCSQEMTVKALAFAHLVNEYINMQVGKLSAICACSMASATAASAACVWLMGGSDEQIGWAIRNMAGAITGMICDGGKVGCALKLATATTSGVMCAFLAMNGAALRVSDGICSETPEDCIRNMGRVSNPGMVQTDKEILHIMLDEAQKKGEQG